VPDALIDRGMALSAGNNYDRAIAEFSAAIKLAPDNARAYYGRGLAYALSGRREEGRADLAKAVGIEPNNQDYRSALSDVDRSRAK